MTGGEGWLWDSVQMDLGALLLRQSRLHFKKYGKNAKGCL